MMANHQLTSTLLHTRWRHQMEIFFALLALCAGHSPVTDKKSWGWWFETPSRSLWRHCNAMSYHYHNVTGQTYFWGCDLTTIFSKMISSIPECMFYNKQHSVIQTNWWRSSVVVEGYLNAKRFVSCILLTSNRISFDIETEYFHTNPRHFVAETVAWWYKNNAGQKIAEDQDSACYPHSHIMSNKI